MGNWEPMMPIQEKIVLRWTTPESACERHTRSVIMSNARDQPRHFLDADGVRGHAPDAGSIAFCL
jgi:hypothetical protein